MSAEPAAAAETLHSPEAYLAEIRRLCEADDPRTAGELAAEAHRRFPSDDRLLHWAYVLQPVMAWVASSGSELDRRFAVESDLRRRIAAEHPGEWVALLRDRLLAHGADRLQVLRAAHDAEPGEWPTLLRLPN